MIRYNVRLDQNENRLLDYRPNQLFRTLRSCIATLHSARLHWTALHHAIQHCIY